MSDLFKKLFGTSTPLKSLAFWGVVFMSGVPTAVAQFFGIDMGPILEKAGPILLGLGIRRRLPS